jgi:hypothetical protein
MTATYKYVNAFGATSTFSVDLGTSAIRLGQIPGLTELAEHCAVGTSSVVIDNPSGTVGHSSDQIIGHQVFTCDEGAAASGNQRVFTGIIGAREYERGDSTRPSLRTTLANQINVTLFDLNALLGFLVITGTDGKRPAETVAARLSWILGSAYLTGLVADNGLVASAAAFGMEACDYRGQRPVNVINDCELASNWFAFVYPDETKTVIASLFFDDANVSTAYTSTVKLSNVLADIDGSTVFGTTDGKLTRKPDDLGSGVYLPYSKGAVYRTRSATVATYGSRDVEAPNSNVKSSGKASLIADNFLWQHHTEEDRISCSVEVPAASVNLIRAGHRIQVKFSHLPGYTSYTWCRVLSRSPGQPVETDQRYTLQLELSPQEAAQTVAGIVQTAVLATGAGGGTSTFPNPVTPGNLLVWIAGKRDLAGAGTGPNTPNTDVAYDRWGAGAWTDGTPGATRVVWDDPRAYLNGMKLWYKTADSTEQGCKLDEYTAGVCYEVSGATIAGATFVHQDQQTFASTYALGSLGTPASGKIALLILGLGAGAADPVSPLVVLNPGVWVRDLHADGFGAVWAGNSNSIAFNQPAPLESWIGHTTTTGAALAATITDTYTHNWAGLAVVLA